MAEMDAKMIKYLVQIILCLILCKCISHKVERFLEIVHVLSWAQHYLNRRLVDDILVVERGHGYVPLSGAGVVWTGG